MRMFSEKIFSHTGIILKRTWVFSSKKKKSLINKTPLKANSLGYPPVVYIYHNTINVYPNYTTILAFRYLSDSCYECPNFSL